MRPNTLFSQMQRPGKRYIQLKVFDGSQRFIGVCDVEYGYGRCRSRSRHVVDRIFQVSKSFTEINEAEIDEKYL